MQFSLADIISGDKVVDNNVSDLFTKRVSEAKAEPVYDYSAVPDRKLKKKNDEEEKLEEKEEEIEEKEEEKRGKRRKRKRDYLKAKDPEQERRTVFVGNLPNTTDKNHLKKLFSEFGKVEAIRFRCALRKDLSISKKVAVIKQKFHEARSNICAFIRFSTKEEANNSCKLNGTQVDGNVIRVDSAVQQIKPDHNKAIFLGNLSFTTTENEVHEAFKNCGIIKGVRIVRDIKTGIGKGFGYVNFASKDGVELALMLEDVKICNRKVRITRSLRKAKTSVAVKTHAPITNTVQKVKKPRHASKFGRKKENKDEKLNFEERFAEKKMELKKKKDKKKKAKKDGQIEEKTKSKDKPKNKVGKAGQAAASKKRDFEGLNTTSPGLSKKEKKKARKLSKSELKKRHIAKKLLG